MRKRISAVAGVLIVTLGAASSAVASRKSERQQNAKISKALKTANGASRTAKSARNTATSVAKSVKSISGTVSSLSSSFNAVLTQINTYGAAAPELGVATIYAGNGPASPSSAATPLSPIATIWSSQVPRGGNNAADATGAILYKCDGPAANPSAGCDVRLRAAIRTTRGSSDVHGAVGGGS